MSRALASAGRWVGRSAVLGAFALFVGCSSDLGLQRGGPGADAFSGTWHAAPPLQRARAAHAVVSTGDALVALGGTGAGGRPVLEIERFDGRAWQIESTLPGRGLNAPAAAVLGREVVVTGGFDMATNVPSAKVWHYDVDARTWREGVPLPAPRGGHAAVVLDGRVHVIGGGNDRSTLADHDAWDPASGRWIRLAPLPRAEGSPAAVVHRGRLYAIGGRSGPSDFGDVYVYDPNTDTWSTGPAIEPRGTAGALEVCGTLMVFGGESQAERRSLASVLRLDPRTGTWIAAEPMPTARNFARAVSLGDAVYVVGGDPEAGNSHAGAGSAVVERYEARCKP